MKSQAWLEISSPDKFLTDIIDPLSCCCKNFSQVRNVKFNADVIFMFGSKIKTTATSLGDRRH